MMYALRPQWFAVITVNDWHQRIDHPGQAPANIRDATFNNFVQTSTIWVLMPALPELIEMGGHAALHLDAAADVELAVLNIFEGINRGRVG
jgi:hypothetical protein